MITLQFTKAEKQEQVSAAETEERTFEHCRILLVEDNDINREIACELLGSKGLIVETARDGKEALDCFIQSQNGYYKLILMDIQMPVMNGYEATRAIRKLGGTYAANIPIVALTANIFQDDIVKAMESGMNDYMTKPMNMPDVEKTLKKWLS